MKKYGVVGYKGKIGSLLLQRPDFVFLDCDVTDIDSIKRQVGVKGELDVVVNCAAISSIEKCEEDYKKAIEVNCHGLTNLHRVFGSRVLNISSDHVFDGRKWMLPKEDTAQSPINSYGMTKLASEMVSLAFEGKTIRLSRTVSHLDSDIDQYFYALENSEYIEVPDFLSRNYIHRDFAVDGIVYMAKNWDKMPQMVHYAGTENVTMYSFIKMVAVDAGFRPQDVTKRGKYNDSLAPRPRKGGLNISLAKSLGFPMYNISDTVSKVVDGYINEHM